MKIVECEQQSPAWHMVRLGIPTASCFDRIITPKDLTLSKAEARYNYANKLLAEWLTGVSQDSDYQSLAMMRGLEMEPRARKWYELERDVKVAEVGFVLSDDGQMGCSPDGLVTDLNVTGGLEIKCPEAAQCVAYLTGRDQLGTDKHKLQIMGSLLITGLPWWDVLCWHPDMSRIPPVLVRVERDEEAIEKIRTHLNTFISELNQAKSLLQDKGCTPAGRVVTFSELIK